MEITEFQKVIYNIYLKVLGKSSKRAYRGRKNFNTLSEKVKITLKRLEQFFNSHKDINIEDFFQAGFMFLNESFVQLDFFISYRAIIAYKKAQI